MPSEGRRETVGLGQPGKGGEQSELCQGGWRGEKRTGTSEEQGEPYEHAKGSGPLMGRQTKGRQAEELPTWAWRQDS